MTTILLTGLKWLLTYATIAWWHAVSALFGAIGATALWRWKYPYYKYGSKHYKQMTDQHDALHRLTSQEKDELMVLTIFNKCYDLRWKDRGTHENLVGCLDVGEIQEFQRRWFDNNFLNSDVSVVGEVIDNLPLISDNYIRLHSEGYLQTVLWGGGHTNYRISNKGRDFIKLHS